ncbi:unnamed protein product, partial [Symbiodinium sp. KB8]
LSLGVGGKLGVCAPVGARVGMPPQMPSWWRRSAHRSLMPVPRWLLGLLCIAATLPSAVTFLCRPAVIGSDAGRSSGRTQLAATAAPIARRKKGSALVKRIPPPSVKVTKLAKGERYRGYINPKLKALVAAPEYRKVVDLLFKLENEKKLDMLLANAQDYWLGLNIYEASRLEREQGRKAVSKIIRRDWSRIWPKELEDSRLEAYDLFSAFWRRVEQSQIIDTMIGEVLPDLKRGYDSVMDREGQDRLLSLSETGRLEEFQSRFNDSTTADQYRILAENDTAIPVLSEKLLPFFVRGMDDFEYKIANTPVALPGWADIIVGTVVVLGFVLVLALSGELQLPSMDEQFTLERSAPKKIIVPVPPPSLGPLTESGADVDIEAGGMDRERSREEPGHQPHFSMRGTASSPRASSPHGRAGTSPKSNMLRPAAASGRTQNMGRQRSAQTAGEALVAAALSGAGRRLPGLGATSRRAPATRQTVNEVRRQLDENLQKDGECYAVCMAGGLDLASLAEASAPTTEVARASAAAAAAGRELSQLELPPEIRGGSQSSLAGPRQLDNGLGGGLVRHFGTGENIVLHLQFFGQKDVFAFGFGCIVCWSLEPNELDQIRDAMKPFLVRPQERSGFEEETMNFLFKRKDEAPLSASFRRPACLLRLPMSLIFRIGVCLSLLPSLARSPISFLSRSVIALSFPCSLAFSAACSCFAFLSAVSVAANLKTTSRFASRPDEVWIPDGAGCTGGGR